MPRTPTLSPEAASLASLIALAACTTPPPEPDGVSPMDAAAAEVTADAPRRCPTSDYCDAEPPSIVPGGITGALDLTAAGFHVPLPDPLHAFPEKKGYAVELMIPTSPIAHGRFVGTIDINQSFTPPAGFDPRTKFPANPAGIPCDLHPVHDYHKDEIFSWLGACYGKTTVITVELVGDRKAWVEEMLAGFRWLSPERAL
jgi:hypothetical protein